VLALTGAVLALAIIGALVRGRAASRRRAADTQFERDASLKDAWRQQAEARKSAAAPYAQAARADEEDSPASGTQSFAPPEQP